MSTRQAETGTIAEVWRYPVKSMGGEQLDEAPLDADGLRGDRGWALRDVERGEIVSAKRLPAVLQCSARYLAEPGDAWLPEVAITLPGGEIVGSDERDANQVLSGALGREVTLERRQPAENVDYFRSGPPGGDPLAEARAILGLSEGEPFPDFSEWPAEMRGFVTAPGTYFDLAPLHVMTTSSLAEMQARNPAANWDRRRFRPNVLLEWPATGTPESSWRARRLELEEGAMEIMIPTVRCAMPTHPQPGLDADPGVMRTLVRETGQFLGAYATVVAPGRLQAGGAATLSAPGS